MGTKGKTISLRARNLSLAEGREIRLRRLVLHDPIMRRPSADRGEKRVIHGNDYKVEEAA